LPSPGARPLTQGHWQGGPISEYHLCRPCGLMNLWPQSSSRRPMRMSPGRNGGNGIRPPGPQGPVGAGNAMARRGQCTSHERGSSTTARGHCTPGSAVPGDASQLQCWDTVTDYRRELQVKPATREGPRMDQPLQLCRNRTCTQYQSKLDRARLCVPTHRKVQTTNQTPDTAGERYAREKG